MPTTRKPKRSAAAAERTTPVARRRSTATASQAARDREARRRQERDRALSERERDLEERAAELDRAETSLIERVENVADRERHLRRTLTRYAGADDPPREEISDSGDDIPYPFAGNAQAQTAGVITFDGPDPSPAGVIPTRIAEQDKELHGLHDQIGKLHDRLAPVLRPAEDTDDSGVLGYGGGTGEHAEIIGQHTSIISQATGRIVDLNQRLEL